MLPVQCGEAATECGGSGSGAAASSGSGDNVAAVAHSMTECGGGCAALLYCGQEWQHSSRQGGSRQGGSRQAAGSRDDNVRHRCQLQPIHAL